MSDAQQIIEKQGWSDKTLLDLALEYIGNQQSPEAWTDFLHEKADSENPDTEAMIAAWRAENADDSDNHNYEGPRYPDSDGAAPACLRCGDSPAGLLHAFDPQFPPGFFDEEIVEAQENSR